MKNVKGTFLSHSHEAHSYETHSHAAHSHAGIEFFDRGTYLILGSLKLGQGGRFFYFRFCTCSRYWCGVLPICSRKTLQKYEGSGMPTLAPISGTVKVV